MNKWKAILKWSLLVLGLLIFGFISFLLYETQDEANADLGNIETKLNALYNPKRMGGFAVAVFTADSVLYSQGFGYADQEKQIPYTTTTTQYIASIAKTTIGVSLLKAVELDLINLDDPINKHLPFKVINPAYPQDDITIRQLATHTSSLTYNEQVVESLYIDELEKNKSLRAFFEDYFQNGTFGKVTYSEHPPGSYWDYSNIGAGLAAFIIEYRSGMTYADFTSRYLFEPLNLDNTSWFMADQDSSVQHTQYYEPAEDAIQPVGTKGVQLYPCRDMITTMEDLTKYCQAVMSKKSVLLKDSSYEILLGPNLPSSVSQRETDNHGIFFMIDRNQYGITYQLTGGTGGDNCINTIMFFDSKTGLGYNFIGNTGSSPQNRANHILIYRALVSLGDHLLMDDPNISRGDWLKYKWHNWYSRVRAFF